MDYDKAYTDRCKCGEPALTFKADIRTRTSDRLVITAPVKIGYCLGCYAKMVANESIKQLTEARND